ncbi:DegT/DnrJ/EryC1/StrS family aminotransferase [Vibrio fluvialis]|uniref:DegT/DnrJ/EryC1/StrS family aminotransferase n=1 Tax=Vibrio fluvialis TaxID=676 RepID=UPI001EEA0929|nr:DegT/DnrJ/EryC1/StrS aminotransferase family protein [Vibrio fluvialis]MCG6349100.1 DegT/DnrJ/EryC1/StrS aminotransferase family protein [Vibrio fluvialis]
MIPVYQPCLNGNEKKYINQCLESGWISSKGEFIDRFETEFATFLDVKFATTVCNGTVALHLALMALKIGPGDEVIVPSFTYIASVNTIVQTGATPVFVEVEGESLQLDIKDVEKKITEKTKAVMAVHLYGQASDVLSLRQLCNDKGLYLVEDCAEAIGTSINGKMVGTFGDVSTFSFFGNKTITSGEGGMVVSNNKDIMDLCLRLKNQGVVKDRRYWHDIVAYNYRMTNLNAAIGVAQLERVHEFIKRKREIAKLYEENLTGLPLSVHKEKLGTVHTYWLTSIILSSSCSDQRDSLIEFLDLQGIESRPFFYPAHTLPMYENITDEEFPLSNSLSSRGINLPSWPGLNDEQVVFICKKIKEYFK